MKILPLIITLIVAAFYGAKAQVPDSEQPLQIAGKINLIDPSGHHLGITSDKQGPMLFVFQTDLSIIDQNNHALDLSALQNGMPVTVYYSDLTNVGRLLVTKLVVFPLPVKAPETTPAAAPAAAPAAQ